MEVAYILIEQYTSNELESTLYPPLEEEQERRALEHIYAYSTGTTTDSTGATRFKSVSNDYILGILEDMANDYLSLQSSQRYQ